MSRPLHIFLIDDDPTFLFLTVDMISSTGINTKVKEFPDGEKALIFLKNNLTNPDNIPDIIFVDLHMPVVDGWDFINEFSSLHLNMLKNTLLYIVSSSISPHDIVRAKQIPIIADFLIKPLHESKLREIKEKVIGINN